MELVGLIQCEDRNGRWTPYEGIVLPFFSIGYKEFRFISIRRLYNDLKKKSCQLQMEQSISWSHFLETRYIPRFITSIKSGFIQSEDWIMT